MNTIYENVSVDSPEVKLKKKQLENDIKSKSTEEVRAIWVSITKRSECSICDDSDTGEFYSPGITWDWWMELIRHYAKL